MKCPFCNFNESKVVETRSSNNNEKIKRRRECMRCFKRFTTYEVIESIPLIVIKKDKSREAFDRNKLLNGLLRACEKRPIPLSKIEASVEKIENILQSSFENEIPSSVIGEHVMNILKDIDKVAYVRFASVYREFDDVSNFMEELKRLLKDK